MVFLLQQPEQTKNKALTEVPFINLLRYFDMVLLTKEFDFWQVKFEILLDMQVMLSSSKQFRGKALITMKVNEQ